MAPRSQQTPAEVVATERATVAALLDVDVDAVHFDDGGWDSRVYVVGDGADVFKFPRDGRFGAEYAVEIAVLRLLSELPLPVAVPRVRWEDPEWAYFGYEGVVGRQLSECEHDLSPSERVRIGTLIGGFLRVLHEQELTAPVVPVASELAEYQDKYRLALPVLAQRLSPTELDVVSAFFSAELPDRMSALGCESRLCHADLGPWNVIVGSAGVVGVIDFGDVGYYDASKDFIALPAGIDEAALSAYGGTDLLREKVAVRARAFPIVDLPFYIGKGDEAGITASVARVRRTFLS